ncbi:KOW motif-containing protein [Stachybotrys elegans]|uniref:KOW motif-containing protein n=1 Tax=Stachybotrys elegans TaxID=80388 RepID=A0A8K0STH4_9HYPO|nr:KOW motif-containing protein [Stachybotrys elegans]
MQKLIKRANQAQRQAAKRATEIAKKERTILAVQSRGRISSASKEIRQNIKDARKARREDWELGPLAPKRDLGFNKYGLINEIVRADWSAYGTQVMRPEVVEKRCAWAGGVKELCLVPNDRVVILEGPDKGKIDRIRAVNIETGSVTLDKCHHSLMSNSLTSESHLTPMPISIDSVRLVHPLTDPKTGVTRDVIINELRGTIPNMKSPNMSYDRWEYGQKRDRIVPGLNVVIPWPEVTPPKFETTKADTIRENVEDRTFYYNLLSPPMPESVLDELRNKYSKFRTRHEDWYVSQKEIEEAEKRRRQETIKSMQTPLDEFHEKQSKLRAQQKEPELTDAMLEKLGQLMADKKAAKKAALAEAASSPAPSSAPTASPPQ